MNPWQILGIEPTTDKVLIKKAFAVKVKENPPDKDPQKYQEIREAYNNALAFVKFVQSEKGNESEASYSGMNNEDSVSSKIDDIPEPSASEVSENIDSAQLERIRKNFVNTNAFLLIDKASYYYSDSVTNSSDETFNEEKAHQAESRVKKIKIGFACILIVIALFLYILELL